MATFDFPIRRLIVVGGFAAAVAVMPAIAVFAGPSPTMATPMAECPPGEHEDSFTYACVPELVPTGTGVTGVTSPGPSERQLEQDIYDTPGFLPEHAGGTGVQ